MTSPQAAAEAAGAFRTLDDVDVRGKRVLLRVDLNVPMADGAVLDGHPHHPHAADPARKSPTGAAARSSCRISAGRRNGPDRANSLEPLAIAIERELGRVVAFADDCVGPQAEAAVAAMADGDIVLLENTRFHAGETKNDPALVAAMAKLGDLYVNDAFSAAHRAPRLDRGPRPRASGRRRPRHAGRTRPPRPRAAQPRAPGRGDRRAAPKCPPSSTCSAI